MKNYTKTIGFAIIAMVITLAFAACDTGNGTTHTCTPGAAATCVTPQTCTDAACGKVIVAAPGHDWEADYTHTPATCTEAEHDERNCTRDGCTEKDVKDEIGGPLGHDWIDNWQANAIAATETEDGKDERTCDRAVCNEKQTRAAETPEYATGTAGLLFTTIADGDHAGYRVYKGSVTTGAVHIPAMRRPNATSAYLPVTTIGVPSAADGSGAFQGTTITAITFADQTKITYNILGNHAFSGVGTLTTVIIPTAINDIRRDAFNGCNALASITIGADVTISATGHAVGTRFGDFKVYYEDAEGGNKAAGTYTWNGTAWTGP